MDLHDIARQVAKTAGADFAFVLSQAGLLVTRDAPREMPDRGRTKILWACPAGKTEIAHLEMPREDLVPYGGAAPVDVFAVRVEEAAILVAVMASWNDKSNVVLALTNGAASLSEMIRNAKHLRAQKAAAKPVDGARRDRPSALPAEPARRDRPSVQPGEPARRDRPSAPSETARRDRPSAAAADTVRRDRPSSAGAETARRDRPSAVPAEVRRARASVAPPDLARRDRSSAVPAEAKGRDRVTPADGRRDRMTPPDGRRDRASVAPPDGRRDRASVAPKPGKATPLTKPAKADAAAAARLEALAARVQAAAKRREARARASSEPEITMGEAPVGRETLVAIEEAALPPLQPGPSPESVRVELASIGRETMLEIARFEATEGRAPTVDDPLVVNDRRTLPWVDPATLKRTVDAKAAVRGVAPPEVKVTVEEIDPETLERELHSDGKR